MRMNSRSDRSNIENVLINLHMSFKKDKNRCMILEYLFVSYLFKLKLR